MQKIKFLYYSFCLCTLFVIWLACRPKPLQKVIMVPTLPEVPYDYSFSAMPLLSINNHFDNFFTETKPYYTNDIVTLGRVLFYDKQLSINATTSCGTCHKQEFSFADNTATSAGFSGIKGTRNAPALTNSRFNWAFFWDSRSRKIEDLILEPIANHIEMGFDQVHTLPKRLEKLSYYPPLFIKAFGTATITNENITKAMASFLRSMTSVKSRVEQSGILNANQNAKLEILNESEHRGALIFASSQGQCINCHLTKVTGKNIVANIGLDSIPSDIGFGFLNSMENGSMVTPNLQNVALTAPYMHDGRFKTLQEVLEHYCCNIKNTKALHPFLKIGNKARTMPLSMQDKNDVINFLLAWTDETIIKDPKFSDPFKK